MSEVEQLQAENISAAGAVAYAASRIEKLMNLALGWHTLPCVCGYEIPNDDRDESQCLSCGAHDILAVMGDLR